MQIHKNQMVRMNGVKMKQKFDRFYRCSANINRLLRTTERQNILNVAPAQGDRPLSVFRYKYSEELAYPRIFLGQRRPENKKHMVELHYSEICKSELRSSNRRPAKCVENILCKTKTSQMKILLGQSQIALRKCNSRIQNAGNLKQQRTFDSLIFHNEGFKFLRASRSSPPYFGKVKRDLFVMKTVRSSFLVLQFLISKDTMDTPSQNTWSNC